MKNCGLHCSSILKISPSLPLHECIPEFCHLKVISWPMLSSYQVCLTWLGPSFSSGQFYFVDNSCNPSVIRLEGGFNLVPVEMNITDRAKRTWPRMKWPCLPSLDHLFSAGQLRLQSANMHMTLHEETEVYFCLKVHFPSASIHLSWKAQEQMGGPWRVYDVIG